MDQHESFEDSSGVSMPKAPLSSDASLSTSSSSPSTPPYNNSTSSFLDDDSTVSSLPPPPPPPREASAYTLAGRKVQFDGVAIRYYDKDMSDNPSVSCGPPIGLAWTHEKMVAWCDMAVYEEERFLERRDISNFSRRGRVGPEERIRICLEGGWSVEEIEQNVLEIQEIQSRMIASMYGVSPFENINAKWQSFTEQVNMSAVVAAKKFTRLWRKKTADRKEAKRLSEEAGEEGRGFANRSQGDEITSSAGATPTKKLGSVDMTFMSTTSTSEASEVSDDAEYFPPETLLNFDHTRMPTRSALKKKSSIKPLAPPPPPPPPPAGGKTMDDIDFGQGDFKDFKKHMVSGLKQKEGKKEGPPPAFDDDMSIMSTDSFDDSNVKQTMVETKAQRKLMEDMERSMGLDDDILERVSWSSGGSGGSEDGRNKKDCVVS